MDTDDREPQQPQQRARSRSRERSRSRDRSERDDRRGSEPHRPAPHHGHGHGGGRGAFVNPMQKAMSREVAANEAAKRSRKECRVYVGNLAFGVKWNDLKDFMREAGNVVFSEILLLPNGMSKGCGVVEFSQPEEAQRAIRELNDQQLLGRPVFVREDREESAKYGAAAISGRAGYMGPGAFAGGARGGFGGGFGGRGGFGGVAPGFGGPVAGGGSGRHLFVQGLPFTVGWQDLKDLFRAAGSIIRADVKMNPDGSHSGTGTVIYETQQDAQTAIDMYNGFPLDVGGQQSVLEVRHDRFPLAFAGGARGGFGGARGGFGGGFGGRGGFGGAAPFGGGMAPGFGAPGVYGAYGAAAAGGGFGAGGFGAQGMGGGFAGLPTGPAAGVAHMLPPSHQLFVRNLPWSTSNEDLVELFTTCGTVTNAEVLFEHGRSKGSGVVELGSVDEATTAKERFNGYLYGGRPLAIDYNQRPHAFAAVVAAPVADYGEAGLDGVAPV
ncbi:hypothetical protein JCM3775_001713 [Rhodotorula graminis]